MQSESVLHWQVVNYMFRCMKTENLDHSLIRHFISEVSSRNIFSTTVCICMHMWVNVLFQVLSIIQPPYSAEFGSVFLPLVQNQDIAGPLVNADGTDIVSQFIGTCTSTFHCTYSVTGNASILPCKSICIVFGVSRSEYLFLCVCTCTCAAECPRKTRRKKKNKP